MKLQDVELLQKPAVTQELAALAEGIDTEVEQMMVGVNLKEIFGIERGEIVDAPRVPRRQYGSLRWGRKPASALRELALGV